MKVSIRMNANGQVSKARIVCIEKATHYMGKLITSDDELARLKMQADVVLVSESYKPCSIEYEACIDEAGGILIGPLNKWSGFTVCEVGEQDGS